MTRFKAMSTAGLLALEYEESPDITTDTSKLWLCEMIGIQECMGFGDKNNHFNNFINIGNRSWKNSQWFWVVLPIAELARIAQQA